MSTSAVRNDSTASPGGNRWLILVAGVLVQLAIGAVYAWSVFAKAIQSHDAFGWSKAQASVPFEVAIGMIFVGSYIGGRIQDRRGPRTVALTGGIIYSLGVIFYVAKRIPYNHAIWHLFVLGGSLCHFAAIYGYV